MNLLRMIDCCNCIRLSDGPKVLGLLVRPKLVGKGSSFRTALFVISEKDRISNTTFSISFHLMRNSIE